MSLVFLPEELIVEILSYLPVKSLMQLRCVNKAWNTLISDPKFIKLHLQQSKKNSNLTQVLCVFQDYYMVRFPLNILLNKPSIVDSNKQDFPSEPKIHHHFIGSCNGLFCLFVVPLLDLQNTWFQLWNPATNTFSTKFRQHLDSKKHDYLRFTKCSFGYDNLTDTYKIVYFRPNQFEIFSFSYNARKIIQLPNLVPLNCWHRVPTRRIFHNEDVSLNDTIILLARDIAQQIVIISLNLSTDAYSKLLPPQDFVEVSLHSPTLHVLEDSLYFSHHTQETHFIIWKMTEFGNENSWTQFLKISYEDLNIHIHIQFEYFLAPLYLYEGGIALVQAADIGRTEVIVYNWSDNRIVKTRMDSLMLWMINQNYVESLVPTS